MGQGEAAGQRNAREARRAMRYALNEVRNSAGLTIEEVARKTGLSRSTIQAACSSRGDVMPSSQTVNFIATACGGNAAQLADLHQKLNRCSDPASPFWGQPWRAPGPAQAVESSARPATAAPPDAARLLKRRARARRAGFVAALVAAALVAGAGVAAVLVAWSRGDGSAAHRQLVAAASVWPDLVGCDGVTAVAMPPGSADPRSFRSERDIRETLVRAGGGSWEQGFLTVDLSVTGRTAVDLIDIKPHILRSDLAAPSWVFHYYNDKTCGGPQYDFALNLDRPSLQPNRTRGPDGGTSPFGAHTELRPGQHKKVTLVVNSCSGNYRWLVDVHYVADGGSRVHSVAIGPFTSYGLGARTRLMSGTQNATGAIRISGGQHLLTGAEPECGHM